jgi:hypothetical protein
MKCLCGNPMRQMVVALDDIWWSCLICGRAKPKTEGDNDMASHRGWCNHCNKSDRPLISVTAKICHSCYKRQNYARKKNAVDFGLESDKASVAVTEPVKPAYETAIMDACPDDMSKVEVNVDMSTDENIPSALPPNWGKVPCEICGNLVDFGHDCTCRVIADDELYDYSCDPPPTIKMDALLRLIETDGWLVEIPRDLCQRLHDDGITPAHIVELCEMLLNGELRKTERKSS